MLVNKASKRKWVPTDYPGIERNCSATTRQADVPRSFD